MRIRTTKTIATAAFMGLILAAAPASAVLAGAAPAAASQPDGRVRLQKIAYEQFPTETYARPWLGNDVYNATGRGQAAKESWFDSTPGWQSWVFGVSVQNDGTSSDRIRVHSTGAAMEGWSVKYFHGTTNLTAAVVAGTFTTPSISPGAEYVIKVKLTRDGDYYDAGDVRRVIALTSLNNTNRTDTVKVVLEHVVCTC